MKQYVFKIPLFFSRKVREQETVTIRKGKTKKKWTGRYKTKNDYINLNQYRNWHYQLSNDIKDKYKQFVKQYIDDNYNDMCEMNKISVYYTLHAPDKRIRDKGNVLSVNQKFFLDALVQLGYLEDDNDNFVKKETFCESVYDKANGHVEITIKEIE